MIESENHNILKGGNIMRGTSA